MINRRHFLKSSLFVGAGTLLGEQTNILNAQTVEVSSVCSEDVPPVRKGKSVMGLCCKPLDVVRIGIIGLRRGGRAVKRLSQIEGVEIVAICDLLPERVAASQAVLKKNGRKQAMEYIGEEDWRKICERDDIDLIYNATPWELHYR